MRKNLKLSLVSESPQAVFEAYPDLHLYVTFTLAQKLNLELKPTFFPECFDPESHRVQRSYFLMDAGAPIPQVNNSTGVRDCVVVGCLYEVQVMFEVSNAFREIYFGDLDRRARSVLEKLLVFGNHVLGQVRLRLWCSGFKFLGLE